MKSTLLPDPEAMLKFVEALASNAVQTLDKIKETDLSSVVP
jgi:hypothetical protein